MHPSKLYFAVGEKGYNPNIYILKYPSMEIYKTLSYGTQKSYATISFNKEGTKLASVGGSPDFTLTVWDWETEAVILKSKAFGQVCSIDSKIFIYF